MTQTVEQQEADRILKTAIQMAVDIHDLNREGDVLEDFVIVASFSSVDAHGDRVWDGLQIAKSDMSPYAARGLLERAIDDYRNERSDDDD